MKRHRGMAGALIRLGVFAAGCLVCLHGCAGHGTGADGGAANQAPGQAVAPAAAFVSDPLYDFGTVMEGERIEHTFVIENRGGLPLTIDQVRPGKGCTTTPIAGPIPAGDRQNLVAAFDTTHQGGREVIRRITLVTNDPRQPESILTLRGKVDAYADISPKGIRLIAQLDEVAERQVRIVPHPQYPFAILRAAPVNGRDLVCEVMPLGVPAERVGYLLTVTSVRETPGPIDDFIEVSTDNPHVPPLMIRVKGLMVKSGRPIAEEK